MQSLRRAGPRLVSQQGAAIHSWRPQSYAQASSALHLQIFLERGSLASCSMRAHRLLDEERLWEWWFRTGEFDGQIYDYRVCKRNQEEGFFAKLSKSSFLYIFWMAIWSLPFCCFFLNSSIALSHLNELNYILSSRPELSDLVLFLCLWYLEYSSGKYLECWTLCSVQLE